MINSFSFKLTPAFLTSSPADSVQNAIVGLHTARAGLLLALSASRNTAKNTTFLLDLNQRSEVKGKQMCTHTAAALSILI